MPIFDQGYQHWKGTLSGHAWRWLAITKQGLRGQLKNRNLRLLLLTAWAPALALGCALAVWGLFEQGSENVLPLLRPVLPSGVAADPRAYRGAIWTIAYSIFFKSEIIFIMLLMVIAGPNLISGDLRFNALPLYFSRPLRRLDYLLGKLGVIAALVAAVAVGPATAAYLLGLCFSLDLGMIADTWRLLPVSIVYGLVIAVSAGTLMLALSSLSRRSLYVGIAWAGLWLVSSAVAAVLAGIQRDATAHAIWRERQEAIAAASRAAQGPRQGPQRRPPQPQAFQPMSWRLIQEQVQEAEIKAAPRNWRPLCSYTANLQRLGEALLRTDAAWVQLGRATEVPRAALQPFLGGGRSPPPNERRLADTIVPQYPWTWSAGVLAALLGLSLWTLNHRVKSLDRLR
jgi:ABC-2 type transport system permease protein